MLLFGGLAPVQALAQEAETFLADLRSLVDQQKGRVSSPAPRAATVGIPGGFGLRHGSIGFGTAITNRRDRINHDWDVSGAIGFGFGNARTGIGGEVTLGLVSMSLPGTRGGGGSVLGEDGNLGIKFFREFRNSRTGQVSALAIGASNALRWGDPKSVPVNYYVAGSTTFTVPWAAGMTRPGILTLGAGTAVRNLERDPGIFGGVGLGVTSWAAVGASWMGDEAILGVNLFPQLGSHLNVQVGLYYADATRRVSPSGRFILNVSVLAKDLY